MTQSNVTKKAAVIDQTLNATPEQKAIFTLSYLSNINGSYLADSEQDLSDNINGANGRMGVAGALKTILNGNWSLEWGPSISNSPVTIDKKKYYVTDNAIFMARYNGDGKDYKGPKYVIAVAGTNPFSMRGWLDEDFLVSETKSWPADFLTITDADANVKNPLISKGTYEGLQTLMSIKSGGSTILDYIKNNSAFKNTSVEIAVAGHSLGGALSPTLAVALAQSLKGLSGFSNLQFSAYPTAGPTPGNSDFAQVLNDKLATYDAIYNMMDAVPQAWNNLTAIPTLFDPCSQPPTFTIDGKNNKIVMGFYNCVSKQPAIDYERQPNTPSSGFSVQTWNNGCITSKSLFDRAVDAGLVSGLVLLDENIMSNLKKICGERPGVDMVKGFADFLVELGEQHTTAYTDSRENGFQIDDATMQVIRDCMHGSKAQAKIGGKYVLEQFAQVTANTCYSKS